MSVLPELERLSRHDLISRAQRLGVQRAELMTRVELTDEIVRLSESDPTERRRARGWLGIARDLVASVVEQGLHLPEAAALIRGEHGFELGQRAPAPVATVTLAEIYAAQGHLDRGLKMLDQVLEKEPEHDAARGLRDKLTREHERRGAARSESRARAAARFAEPEFEPEPDEDASEEEPAEFEVTPEPAPAGLEHPEVAGESAEPEPTLPLAAAPEPAALEVPAVAAASRDAVLLMRQPSGKVLVYWELRPESRRRAEERRPAGQAVVRVVGWRASWDGAERIDHDLVLPEDSGSASIESLGDVHVVRAILGWRAAGVVDLFAIAHELGASAAASAYELVWSPPGHGREAAKLSVTTTRALARWGLGPES